MYYIGAIQDVVCDSEVVVKVGKSSAKGDKGTKQWKWLKKQFWIGLQFWFKVSVVCALCFRFLISELRDQSVRVQPLLYGPKGRSHGFMGSALL